MIAVCGSKGCGVMAALIDKAAFGVFVIALALIAIGFAYLGFEMVTYALDRMIANLARGDFISVAFGTLLFGGILALGAAIVGSTADKFKD